MEQLKSVKKIFDQPLKDLERRMPRVDKHLQEQWRRRHLRSPVIRVREGIRETPDFRQ